ncbi:hypothetical protein AK830_g1068 [Neonectria ditissima]|uniref:Heterokaryon incompatibility domain-containing protein n=1 Tax=Neonectria ditissima TaxID=78410 RepID=A0A0P7BJX2_9HYPO|nr:hypothetical protein AK830_g1068 [Neonectria ditissima]
MPLCHLCLDLDLATISRSGVIRRFNRAEGFPAHHDLFYYIADEPDLGDAGKHLLTPYHKSLESLQANAKFCDLCGLVQRSVNVVLENMAKANDLDYKYPVSGYELWIADIDDADGFQVLGFHEESSAEGAKDYQLMGGFAFCVDDGEVPSSQLLFLKLHRLIPLIESQLGAVIEGRKITESPLSPSVLDKVKAWMSQCTEQHEHEKSASPPTRVLEIGQNGDKVFLRSSNSATADYASLSHCWGSVRPATLTLSTIETLSMGIRTSELPQTFQDAVWLTHQLGIRNLWIDSLCIFQDDHDDWTKESAQMCDVYRNSVLTIAASRAAGSSEGFLGTRLNRSYISIPFHTDGISGNVSVSALPLSSVGNLIQESLQMKEEPLTGRAWALQERFLSRRTLHFSRSQIHFECERRFFSEDGFGGSLWSIGNMFTLNNYDAEWHKESCRRHWREVVTLYSERKLTFEDDKLPAVEGLAAYYSLDSIPKDGVSVPGNRYLAGLWFDDLLQDMCWEIDRRNAPGVRPQTYRAPTWSWASVDGPIQHNSADSMKELAIVQDAHIDLESSNSPFGKVTGGWVQLKVIRLRPCRLPDQTALCFCEDGVGFYAYCQWDAESYLAPEEDMPAKQSEGETELFAIPLGWIGQGNYELSKNRVVGPTLLILKEVKHDIHSHAHVPGFQRVGSGVAQWESGGEEGSGKDALVRLIVDKWEVAKEHGDLEDILLL